MKRGVGIIILAIVFVSSAAAQGKKRVAVMDFDYSTVKTSADAVFGTSVDVGKGIADMIVTNLVKSGVYSVIERKALDKILAEQNFSNSDRADPTSAAKLAKLLGVNAVIIGSITQFGRDDKATNIGGGGLGRITGGFGIGGRNRVKATGSERRPHAHSDGEGGGVGCGRDGRNSGIERGQQGRSEGG